MGKPKKEKPGVMLYWETFDALEELVDGEAKMMLRAIRQYAQYGETPDFGNSPVCKMAWVLLKPKIDADGKRYAEISESRRNSANARWHKDNMQTDTDDCK